MKVIAFSASNSRSSINGQLVHYAADTLRGLDETVEVRYLDLNDYEMPIFSVDREEESGIPKLAEQFFQLIGSADAVMVSFAEHNGSYSVAYKNVFDWASRINSEVFQGKPVIAFSASPGPRGGAGVLDAFISGAPFFGAQVKGALSVGSFHDRFNTADREPEPGLASEIYDTVLALVNGERSGVE